MSVRAIPHRPSSLPCRGKALEVPKTKSQQAEYSQAMKHCLQNSADERFNVLLRASSPTR
jgi:hypothetical protein